MKRLSASAQPVMDIPFDTTVYDREAVLAACASLGESAAFEVSSERSGMWTVRLRLLTGIAPDDPERLAGELGTRVADQQVRLNLDRRTAPIRRLVYEYAFADSGRKK
jgi:His-Xaa-Ser system protein HxsD